MTAWSSSVEEERELLLEHVSVCVCVCVHRMFVFAHVYLCVHVCEFVCVHTLYIGSSKYAQWHFILRHSWTTNFKFLITSLSACAVYYYSHLRQCFYHLKHMSRI